MNQNQEMCYVLLFVYYICKHLSHPRIIPWLPNVSSVSFWSFFLYTYLYVVAIFVIAKEIPLFKGSEIHGYHTQSFYPFFLNYRNYFIFRLHLTKLSFKNAVTSWNSSPFLTKVLIPFSYFLDLCIWNFFNLWNNLV